MAPPERRGRRLELRLYRPLPLTVAPVHDETLTSYVRRLAGVNRLDGGALRVHLTGGDPRKSARISLNTLALVSGQPATVLRYAILELAAQRDLITMHLTDRPRPGGHARPQCEHCTLSRGHPAAMAWCWHLHEDLVCHRHRRWIGDGRDYAHHGHPDLSGQPDILVANRRHRELIRRHGRLLVIDRFRQATTVCELWHQHRAHDADFSRLMAAFHGKRWRVSPTDPTVHAARYPQVVALTRLLASPTWGAKAQQNWPEPTEFIHEIRRTVAPRYIWVLDRNQGKHDPLVEVIAADYEDRPIRDGLAHDDLGFETIQDPRLTDYWRARREVALVEQVNDKGQRERRD